MDKSNFLRQIKQLASPAHRTYLQSRLAIAMAARDGFTPFGDRELEDLNREAMDLEVKMWAKGLQISDYAKGKLEE